jgi:transposase
MSDRTMACQIGVARSTLQEYLARVEAAGLSWPLPEDMTDEALEHLLFPRPAAGPVSGAGSNRTGRWWCGS